MGALLKLVIFEISKVWGVFLKIFRNISVLFGISRKYCGMKKSKKWRDPEQRSGLERKMKIGCGKCFATNWCGIYTQIVDTTNFEKIGYN